MLPFFRAVICFTASLTPKEFIISLKKRYTYAQTHACTFIADEHVMVLEIKKGHFPFAHFP